MENIPKDLQNIIYDYVRQLKISNINDNIKDLYKNYERDEICPPYKNTDWEDAFPFPWYLTERNYNRPDHITYFKNPRKCDWEGWEF